MDRKLLMLIVAPAALAAGLLLSFWLMKRSMGPTVEQDPAQYQAFMAKWPVPDVTRHFPKTIPPKASGVRMVIDPGGMDDAVRVELQMQLPEQDIQGMLRRYGLVPTTGPAGAVPVGSVYVDAVAASRIRITDAGGNPVPLPPEYRMAEFTAVDRDGGWEHGRLYGTAIAPHSRQVIYFAQAW